MAKDLERKLSRIARREGARLFGVAGVERFTGAPPGHHPLDFLPRARSVVVVGLPVLKSIVNYQSLLKESEIITGKLRQEYLQQYFYQITGYDILNQRLEQIVLSLSLYLDDRGFASIYFPATYSGAYKVFQDKVPGNCGIFSMRHAAVRAGLGEFGLNNVVVTPRYGPRIRFNALVTEAELEPTPLPAEQICRGIKCGACLKQCGGAALSLIEGTEDSNINAGEGAVRLDPVSRTSIPACQSKRIEAFCYGRCIQVCPVGG